MALSVTVLNLLQKQYAHEFTNYLRYVQRSTWARYRGFNGAGDFFEGEANDELKHAEIVKKYIEDRSEIVMPAPYAFEEPGDFASYSLLFTSALEVEKGTTASISEIYSTALHEGDFMTVECLKPLFDIQRDEEEQFQSIVDRIVSRGGGGQSLEIATNVFDSDSNAVNDIDVWIDEVYNN